MVSDTKFVFEKFIIAYQDLCDGIDFLNSTFTFQLAPVLVNVLITKTFTAYGVLWAIISPPERQGLTFLQNGSWLAIMYLIETIIAFVGSSVPKAAQETLAVMTKILNTSTLDEDFVLPMQHFVSRVNSRNLDVKNCFFKIDWMILLHVRVYEKSGVSKPNNCYFLVDSNHRHLFGHHLSVWRG